MKKQDFCVLFVATISFTSLLALPARAVECREFILKLTGPDQNNLLKKSPKPTAYILPGEDGVLAHLLPESLRLLVEGKPKEKLPTQTSSLPVPTSQQSNQDLARDLAAGDSVLGSGYMIKQNPARGPKDPIATFVRTRSSAVEKSPPPSLEKAPQPFIPSQTTIYNETTGTVHIIRKYQPGYIDEGFQETLGLQYSLKFDNTHSDSTVIATLTVKTRDGKEYPYVAYKIPRGFIDSLDKGSSFNLSQIAYQTLQEGDQNLRAISPAPKDFWMNLKSSTLLILEDAARTWKRHQKKAA